MTFGDFSWQNQVFYHDMSWQVIGHHDVSPTIAVRVFCKLLLRQFDKIDMTLGQGQWPRINRKNWWIKPAFLLVKSVGPIYSHFIHANITWLLSVVRLSSVYSMGNGSRQRFCALLEDKELLKKNRRQIFFLDGIILKILVVFRQKRTSDLGKNIYCPLSMSEEKIK